MRIRNAQLKNTMKTREEIIDTLKKKTIKAYFDLQEYEAEQGEDAPSTRFFRNRWGTLHLLLEEIGEPLDYKNLKK